MYLSIAKLTFYQRCIICLGGFSIQFRFLALANTVVFTPGLIWGKWVEHAYKRGVAGEGATYR